MASDLTTTGGNLAVVPKLSPVLQKIIDRRDVRPNYGGDEGQEYGFEYRRGPWVRPAWVDVREKAEAAAALPAFTHFAGPMSEREIRRFLNILWQCSKHANDTSWEAVAAAYPMMLKDFPAWCWRPERLTDAASSFAWFPSVAELRAFHAREKAVLDETIEALSGVAEAPTKRPDVPNPRQHPDWKWRNRAEAEAHAEYLRERKPDELAELKRIVAERDAAKAAEKAAGKASEPVTEPAPAAVVTRPLAHIAKPRPFTAAELERVRRLHPGAVPLDDAAGPDVEAGAV